MKIEISNISGSKVSITGGNSLENQEKNKSKTGVIIGNNIEIDGQKIDPDQSTLSLPSVYADGLNINGNKYELTDEIDPNNGNFIYKKQQDTGSSTTSPVKG